MKQSYLRVPHLGSSPSSLFHRLKLIKSYQSYVWCHRQFPDDHVSSLSLNVLHFNASSLSYEQEPNVKHSFKIVLNCISTSTAIVYAYLVSHLLRTRIEEILVKLLSARQIITIFQRWPLLWSCAVGPMTSHTETSSLKLEVAVTTPLKR